MNKIVKLPDEDEVRIDLMRALASDEGAYAFEDKYPDGATTSLPAGQRIYYPISITVDA